MRHSFTRCAFGAVAAILAFSQPSWAAVAPDTLEETLHSNSKARLFNVRMGASVASDGQFTVVGCSNDHAHETDAGSVKVFNSTTGEYLFYIPNPKKKNGRGDGFGASVALSGNILVVGAPNEDTGYVNGGELGTAYVYNLASATPEVPTHTIHNPFPGAPGGDYFGCSVAVSATRIVIGAYSKNTVGQNTGSAYVYDIAGANPTVPTVILDNPLPGGDDYFGWSVAISGTKVAVGAPEDDTVHTGAGAVYVYDIASLTPTEYVAINNPSSAGGLPWPYSAIGERFGWSVAMSAEGKLVVGSPQEIMKDVADNWAVIGRVFVYDVFGATPSPAGILDYPSNTGGSEFGGAVSISGNKVVVGASAETVAGLTTSGSAYVFELGGGHTRIPNPAAGPNSDDRFALSVGISGNAVVVGAPHDDTTIDNSGIAYLFNLAGTPTEPVRVLNDGSPMTSVEFGTSVATNGRYVIVGSPKDDTLFADAGRVFIFDRESVTPTIPVAVVENPTAAGGDLFGAAVAVSGTKFAVSAPGDDVNGENTGAVYVYDFTPGMPPQRIRTLFRFSAAAGDDYGFALSMSGNSLLVGAPGADVGETNSGAAYFYDLTSDPSPEVPILNPDPAVGDYFGYSVAIAGTRIAIGAPLDDNSGGDHGRAYVFDKPAGQAATLLATLNLPEPNAFENKFGSCVGIDGNTVVVGAPFWANTGKICVYDVAAFASPFPTPVLELINPFPGYEDRFASAVAVHGNLVVGGAYNDDVAGPNDSNIEAAGGAFAFDLTTATPGIPVAIYRSPEPIAWSYYGSSVALATAPNGRPIVVTGARTDHRLAYEHGSVSVFVPPPAAEPEVTTLAATNVTSSGATLNAAVDANRAETDVKFIVTATTPLDGEQPIEVTVSPVTGDDSQNVTAPVAGLRAHTEYEFYVAGENVVDSVSGETLTFTTLNTSPVAQADAIGFVGKNLTTELDVLDNDTDADGDELTITQVTQGARGTVAIVDNAITYTAGGTAGEDTFSYTISDGFGGTSTVNVTLTVDVVVPALSVLGIRPAMQAQDLKLTGTANDPQGISRVEVRLNNGSVQILTPPSASDSFTWNLTVLPEQGPNSIEVKAFDVGGNVSKLFTKSFKFAILRPELAGVYQGILKPVGGLLSGSDHHGILEVKVSKNGLFQAKLAGKGYAGAFRGELQRSGEAKFTLPRLDPGAIVVSQPTGKVTIGKIAFTVNVTGGNQLAGTIAKDGTTLATFTAFQNVYTAKANAVAPFTNVPLDVLNPAADKGNYTVLLPAVQAPNHGLSTNAYPQGTGHATAFVTPGGLVKMAGKLADGTRFTWGGMLSKEKIAPVYIPLYGRKGFLTGEVQFDSANPNSDASATLVWVKPAGLTQPANYAAGWADGIELGLSASRYVSPKAATTALPNPVNPGTVLGPTVLPVTASPTPNIGIELFAGALLPAKYNDGRLSQSGSVVALVMPSGGATDLLLSFTAANGKFKGSFKHPLTSKPVTFDGVAHQKQAIAGGFFLFVPSAGSPDAPSSGGVSVSKYVNDF